MESLVLVLPNALKDRTVKVAFADLKEGQMILFDTKDIQTRSAVSDTSIICGGLDLYLKPINAWLKD